MVYSDRSFKGKLIFPNIGELFLCLFVVGMFISLSKHMGDGKVKLGRGPYAISTAILSMYAGF